MDGYSAGRRWMNIEGQGVDGWDRAGSRWMTIGQDVDR